MERPSRAFRGARDFERPDVVESRDHQPNTSDVTEAYLSGKVLKAPASLKLPAGE